MGKEHGLGALEVRVAGHGRRAMPLRLVEEGGLYGDEGRVEIAEHLADVEALVEGDLIVARAPGVELAPHGARELDEAALDVHMDVLELAAEGEAAALQFGPHQTQRVLDGPAFRLVDQSRTLEGVRPGDGAADVVRPEAAIEGEGGGERFRGGVGTRAEASAPGFARARVSARVGHEPPASPRRDSAGRPACRSASI